MFFINYYLEVKMMSITKMTQKLEEATGQQQPARGFMEVFEERERQQRA